VYRNLLIAAVLLPAILAVPAPAWAHKVNVFAYVEGGEVIAETYFADGRKCADSAIEVFDANGKKLLEGKTDAHGSFRFKPPVRSDLLIRLNASMGHQAEYVLPAADLPAAWGIPLPPKEGEMAKTAESGPEIVEPSPAAEEMPAIEETADLTAFEQMIDRAVARQVAPLRRAFEAERDRRRLVDIIGGIGYIVGIMGLIAYLRSRRKG